MPSSWKCYICDNMFCFNNSDQRLEFMQYHSNNCCKLIYPNGVIAYVGPVNGTNNTINEIKSLYSVNKNNQEEDDNKLYINPLSKNLVNKPWITVPEILGYATAKLLVVLRDMYNLSLESELKSLAYDEEQALITELDREKAVKIYCNRNNLVDKIKRIVHIDELLYSILVDDDQIMQTMSYIKSDKGKRLYYIHTNSRNMYARQISCALRRLDKAIYDNKLVSKLNY